MSLFARRRRIAAHLVAVLALVVPASAAAQSTAPSPTFFSPTSPWNQEVPADAPLDPRSAMYVSELQQLARPRYAGGYGSSIMTTEFGVPIYTVGPNQPRVRVKLDGSSAPALQAAWNAVPVPPNARPAAGTDQNLLVYQPATDTLWEFWKMTRQADGWHARYGGRMTGVSTSSGFYQDVFDPRHNYVERSTWGTTAAKASLAAGVITIAELRAGEIRHALHLAVPVARRGVWSLPALQTDGQSSNASAIPLGAHFRLDPTLDIDSLPLSRTMKIIARAAQRYGMIVVNTSGGVGLRAEDPMQYGVNPYDDLFGGQPSWALMQTFPWNRLQLLPLTLRSATGLVAGSKSRPARHPRRRRAAHHRH
jgi:hypothetical protein